MPESLPQKPPKSLIFSQYIAIWAMASASFSFIKKHLVFLDGRTEILRQRRRCGNIYRHADKLLQIIHETTYFKPSHIAFVNTQVKVASLLCRIARARPKRPDAFNAILLGNLLYRQTHCLGNPTSSFRSRHVLLGKTKGKGQALL